MKKNRTRKQWYDYHQRKAINSVRGTVVENFSPKRNQLQQELEVAQKNVIQIERNSSWWVKTIASSSELFGARETVQKIKIRLQDLDREQSSEIINRGKKKYASERDEREIEREKIIERREERIRIQNVREMTEAARQAELKNLQHIKYLENSPSIRANQAAIKRLLIVKEDPDDIGLVKCYYCKKDINTEDVHLEHKKPVFRGGTNERKNLALACPPCNLQKGSKTEAEYYRWREENQRFNTE